eukprot:PhF_6_TR28376/c0_g1_i1/m.42074
MGKLVASREMRFKGGASQCVRKTLHGWGLEQLLQREFSIQTFTDETNDLDCQQGVTSEVKEVCVTADVGNVQEFLEDCLDLGFHVVGSMVSRSKSSHLPPQSHSHGGL